jgi:hypothetical protein
MLIVEDSDLDAAVNALRHAGFRDAPWSYGSMRDPQLFEDKKMQEIHRRMALQHRNIDKNSTRFLFPTDSGVKEKAILLPSSYAHISLSSTPESRFIRDRSIYWPDKELLLESFARTIVQEPGETLWTTKLEMWAIAYVYGQLMVSDDVLDSCPDDEVKTWFDTAIRRHAGGIDRMTVTKWVGKKGYNGPSCDGYIPPYKRVNIGHPSSA